MLGKATPTAFLSTTTPSRVRAFYTKTIGLRLVYEDRFALVFNANGVTLRIQKVGSRTRAATCCP